MSGPRKRVEAAIQRAVVSWIPYPDLVVHATMNENSKEFVSMGICVGITDLLIWRRVGQTLHTLFLELKTKHIQSGLSDSQVNWYRDKYLPLLDSPTTHYAVAFGFEQAKAEITKFYNATTPPTI